jgi:hypothetical protein
VKPKGNSWALGAFLSSDLDDLGLDPFTFRVWLHLCRRANDEQRSWPSIPGIARVCQMSESKARRAVAFLEERGFFHREERTREDGGRTSDLFVLHGIPAQTPGVSRTGGGVRRTPAPVQEVHRPPVPRTPEGIPEEVIPTSHSEGAKDRQPVLPFQAGRIDPSVRLRAVFETRMARSAARAHVETYELARDEWLLLPADFIHAVLDHAAEHARSNQWGLIAMALSNPASTERSIPVAHEVYERIRAAKQPQALEPISGPGTYETDAGLVTVEEVRDGAAFTADGRVIVLGRTAGWKPARGVAA